MRTAGSVPRGNFVARNLLKISSHLAWRRAVPGASTRTDSRTNASRTSSTKGGRSASRSSQRFPTATAASTSRWSSLAAVCVEHERNGLCFKLVRKFSSFSGHPILSRANTRLLSGVHESGAGSGGELRRPSVSTLHRGRARHPRVVACSRCRMFARRIRKPGPYAVDNHEVE